MRDEWLGCTPGCVSQNGVGFLRASASRPRFFFGEGTGDSGRQDSGRDVRQGERTE